MYMCYTHRRHGTACQNDGAGLVYNLPEMICRVQQEILQQDAILGFAKEKTALGGRVHQCENKALHLKQNRHGCLFTRLGFTGFLLLCVLNVAVDFSRKLALLQVSG